MDFKDFLNVTKDLTNVGYVEGNTEHNKERLSILKRARTLNAMISNRICEDGLQVFNVNVNDLMKITYYDSNYNGDQFVTFVINSMQLEEIENLLMAIDEHVRMIVDYENSFIEFTNYYSIMPCRIYTNKHNLDEIIDIVNDTYDESDAADCELFLVIDHIGEELGTANTFIEKMNSNNITVVAGTTDIEFEYDVFGKIHDIPVSIVEYKE